MMIIDVPNFVSRLAKIVLIFSVLCVASCSEKKPEYELGPVRAPQDNPGIIQSMQNKQQQVPPPPVPGYDIPAPRYNNGPAMIDAPVNTAPMQPSIMQPQRPLPPQMAPQQMQPQSFVPQPSNNISAEVRRRPARQFSGAPLPHEKVGFGIASPNKAASYQQASVSEPKKKLSFFDRLKSLFRKEEKPAPEPKRIPTGQSHLVPAGASFVYGDPVKPGQPVPTGEPNLEQELKNFPKTPAEQAAEEDSAWVPPEELQKQIDASMAKTEQGVQFRLKTPNDWEREVRRPAVRESSKPVPASPAKAIPASVSYDEIEQRWNDQKNQTDGKNTSKTEKIDNNKSKPTPEDVDQTGADAVKAKEKNVAPAEEAEVLMEFDISEDGELVNILDIAPAAGE